MRPVIRPITYAAHGCTLKQPAVMPTRPARIPLQRDATSYLLVFEKVPIMCDLKRVVTKPAAAPDKIVFITILATEFFRGTNIERVEPPLKKSQQTHSTIVPRTISEIDAGAKDSFSRSVSHYSKFSPVFKSSFPLISWYSLSSWNFFLCEASFSFPWRGPKNHIPTKLARPPIMCTFPEPAKST